MTEALTFLRDYNVHGTARGRERGGGHRRRQLGHRRRADRSAPGRQAREHPLPPAARADARLGGGDPWPPTRRASPSCLLTAPKQILRDAAGQVTGVLCQRMALGDYDKSGRRAPVAGRNPDFTVECDQVIAAVGQSLDAKTLIGDLPVELNRGWLKTDRNTGATSVDWIFAGGDAVTGPASVVEAVGAGERAAVAIDQYLTGANHAFWRREVAVDVFFDPDADPVTTPRAAVVCLDPEARACTFDEVELSWNLDTACAEARRCLRCDYGKIPASAAARAMPEEEVKLMPSS